MTTTAEQLTEAIAALNGAAAAYNGKKAEIDDALAAAQTGYDALAGDLRGVVAQEGNFVGTVDPDEADPTRVSGGTFKTIGELIGASPANACVTVRLAPGKVHEITADIPLRGRTLTIYRKDYWLNPADPPAILRPAVYADATANRFYQFTDQRQPVRFTNVTIDLSGTKDNAALPFSGVAGSLIGFSHGGIRQIEMGACEVLGPATIDAGDVARNIVTGIGAQAVSMAISGCNLSGNVVAIGAAASSAAIVSHTNNTFAGGAALVADPTASAGRLLMN